ncbi:MAG: D-alanyl-D-alanine carboxipeptidase 3 family signal peptide protein, partial [Pseudomonadota bacterium]
MFTTLRATTTALLCLSAGLFAQTSQAQALPKPVQQALKEAQIPPAAMGTWVQEVSLKAAPARQGKISVNAQTAMVPASVMKLVTSSAALDVFGPAQRWKTHAYITTPIISGVLRGDLILQGGGDPKLVYENFWQLLRQLRKQGLREIEGNIIIDRSLFAVAETTGAEFDGEPSRAYNVGPDALLLNFKALRLRLIPDAGQVKLQSEPPLAGVEMVPPLLGSGPCGDWKDHLTLTWQGKNLLIQGSYPASCGIQNWSIHPHGLNANQYAHALFSALWAELGGSFSGQVKDGKLADLVGVSSPQL